MVHSRVCGVCLGFQGSQRAVFILCSPYWAWSLEAKFTKNVRVSCWGVSWLIRFLRKARDANYLNAPTRLHHIELWAVKGTVRYRVLLSQTVETAHTYSLTSTGKKSAEERTCPLHPLIFCSCVVQCWRSSPWVQWSMPLHYCPVIDRWKDRYCILIGDIMKESRTTVECPLLALNCGITVFYFLRYQPKYDHFCTFQE